MTTIAATATVMSDARGDGSIHLSDGKVVTVPQAARLLAALAVHPWFRDVFSVHSSNPQDQGDLEAVFLGVADRAREGKGVFIHEIDWGD